MFADKQNYRGGGGVRIQPKWYIKSEFGSGGPGNMFGLCYNNSMKKNRQIYYYIILSLICLVGVALPVSALDLVEGEESARCEGCQEESSQSQEATIVDHCATIKDRLKTIQKNDAKTRVFLGGKYEVILNKYIVPLNLRLVENNMSTNGLIDLQNDFAETKAVFGNDYISYQQSLENLVAIDCKAEPKKFHDELLIVRKKRTIMEQDALKMRNLLTQYVKRVTELKGKI